MLEGTGITLGGTADHDIVIHNDAFYDRVLSGGTLAFGESYMDGWWDSKKLDEMITLMLQADLDKKIEPWKMVIPVIKSYLLNYQNKTKAFEVGEKHYDIGNDLYKRMLDKRMVYTCGYWKNANNLDDAQEAKLDLICKKIGLKSGDHVLDIGCGWGSFAKFAAEKYGAKVTGVNNSKEQCVLANDQLKKFDIEIRVQDYREITGQYDHIVSIGMFEHVGVKNYRTYMEVAQRSLKDGGFFLLHTIGGNRSVNRTNPWIDKYIFPNSMLPSAKQISASIEGLFVMEDWHNFGADYDKTLMAWHENFIQHWDEIKDQYNERFKRMWVFYLLTCAASFRSRKNQLWQIVLSKDGVPGGYTSIR